VYHALTGAVLLAVAACSGASAETPAPGAAALPPPAVTYAMPDDVTAMVLPAAGAETRWTQGLTAFVETARQASARDCARSAGTVMPDIPPPMFTRFLSLPDLRFIQAHGFSGGPAPTPWATSPPPGGGTAVPSAQGACLSEGDAAVKDLRNLFVPLQGRWWAELGALDKNAEVKRSYQAFSDCLTSRGAKASTEDGFFSLVDSRLQKAEGAERGRIEQKLGADYAACMRPVEAVREPLRRHLREEFVAAHGQEVEEMRRTLVPQIRQWEKRHGIRLSFPVV
jgi:hypothetical protein